MVKTRELSGRNAISTVATADGPKVTTGNYKFIIQPISYISLFPIVLRLSTGSKKGKSSNAVLH